MNTSKYRNYKQLSTHYIKPRHHHVMTLWYHDTSVKMLEGAFGG